MRINENCAACLLGKQQSRAAALTDSDKRAAFLKEVSDALEAREESETAPFMVYRFNEMFKKYTSDTKDFSEIKKEYNAIVMNMEADIEQSIEASEDPLETALLYARIGNYIDFGAMNSVDKEIFLQMLRDQQKTSLDQAVYEDFRKDCEQAKTLLLLCDNCGEIVLDKLLIRQIKKKYPDLEIISMVRGEDVLNDVTMEDALFVGLDQESKIITNGSSIAGTVPSHLPEREREILENADVVLSKGQGNYESLTGCGIEVYHLFLCKCDLFVSRFGVPALTGMFLKEK